MKHPNLTFSLTLTTAVLIALSACKDKKASTTTGDAAVSSTNTMATSTPGGHFAYIDIDTFEANYSLLKAKKAEFTQQQSSMENELQRSAQQLQSSIEEAQKKAQEGKMSESEGKATKERIDQMQQSLETRKQTMQDQIMKQRDAFTADIHNRLDAFLGRLSETRHYDFIFSYSKTTPNIMYANKGLDITQEVIKGMNEEVSSGKKK